MNADLIAPVIRDLNQDGAINQLLDDAPNTWERNRRYLWICHYIDAFLQSAEPSVPSEGRL
jgi:hypothetical protein